MVHLFPVPASRSDAKLLFVATGAVVLAGLLVAAVLLLASGRASSPTTYQPFDAGVASSIKQGLKNGGPYFVPDPFGGNRNILLALEGSKVVALSDIVPGSKDCRVRWKGSINSFVDCHDRKLTTAEMARYRAEVIQAGASKGDLLIDLRHRDPPPSSS